MRVELFLLGLGQRRVLTGAAQSSPHRAARSALCRCGSPEVHLVVQLGPTDRAGSDRDPHLCHFGNKSGSMYLARRLRRRLRDGLRGVAEQEVTDHGGGD